MEHRKQSLQAHDAELSRRLDAMLDADTKLELDALREPDPSPSGPQSIGDVRPEAADEEESATPEILARVVVDDGGAVEFLAVPADGEVGVAYRGDRSSWSAAISRARSPLALYVAIAPSGAPLPWLVAAIDDHEERAALVGERPLCDRVEETLEAERDGLPGPLIAGARTALADHHESDYCAPGGKEAWDLEWCSGEWNPGPLLEPNLFQCTAGLSAQVTHGSLKGGDWRMRKCSTGWAVACSSFVQIRHQYRKLKGFKWVWVTARDDDFGPTVEPVGTPWQGLVPRRRRITYARTIESGGFRAFSRFSRNLNGGS